MIRPIESPCMGLFSYLRTAIYGCCYGAIRLQMKEAHPDLGGTGDGAFFAKLNEQLKRRGEELEKTQSKRR